MVGVDHLVSQGLQGLAAEVEVPEAGGISIEVSGEARARRVAPGAHWCPAGLLATAPPTSATSMLTNRR